ncbi:MAG: hypothetical protein WD067_10175 [Gaiellaceae bacterium]
MAAAVLWLPAYRGTLDVGSRALLLVPVAAIALLTAVELHRGGTAGEKALAGTARALTLLAAAALAGYVTGRRTADLRGEPLFLYIGVTLWLSWAALVVGTAWLARARWKSFGGLGVTLVVAVLGWFLVTARID